jgi:hypothetical protein
VSSVQGRPRSTGAASLLISSPGVVSKRQFLRLVLFMTPGAWMEDSKVTAVSTRAMGGKTCLRGRIKAQLA